MALGRPLMWSGCALFLWGCGWVLPRFAWILPLEMGLLERRFLDFFDGRMAGRQDMTVQAAVCNNRLAVG